MRNLVLMMMLVVLGSCRTTRLTSEQATVSNTSKDLTAKVELTAMNLSEDASAVSSNDDEIILHIYLAGKDTNALPELLLSAYRVFKPAAMTYKFSTAKFAADPNSIMYLVLIESDTDKKTEQTEPVVRLNLRNICHTKSPDHIVILQNLLGDDDLLGSKILTAECLVPRTTQQFTIEGMHFFDRYHYEVKIEF